MATAKIGSFRKDALRAHGVDAHVPVDKLGDIDIHRHAGKHVGVIAAQVLLLDQEVDHVAHGEGGCFLQVGAEEHV
jgi:hypothetical protein